VRWLADECVAPFIVNALRGAGHDVVSILETGRAASDRFIMAMALQERRVLLTEDNDFGDLVFRGHLDALPGVVLLRLLDAKSAERWRRLSEFLASNPGRIEGHFVVIDMNKTRLTPLPRG